MHVWIPSAVICFVMGCSLSSADYTSSVKPVLPAAVSAMNSTVYSIVFDAGSTGTRIHIYIFHRKTTGSSLELDHEIFESVKPGLSAYVADPEKGADTVRSLLLLALDAVPPTQWKETPLILRATAGLRLLPEGKADSLLSEVTKVFLSSPFLLPENSVSILAGSDEGILAWISVNFLTGHLHGDHSVGMLDLGGGSTQITFLPLSKDTLEESPKGFLSSFELFNNSYRLYTHSYLGLGLKSARVAILESSKSTVQQDEIYRSPCFPPSLIGVWSVDGVTYKYGGQTDGRSGFTLCYSEALRVLKGKLHHVEEIVHRPFYVFSYFYDRAVDSGLIDYEAGGVLEVRDFLQKAKEVCDHMTSESPHSHFLCMDLTYISALLRDGLGFEEGTTLQLRKKVRGVETSWTLGAAFQVLQTFVPTF
ncbi:nucleoside diphosphate phosphatase ENTPD5 [Hyperolius riggenbachi]|uniref:nucleoside diphosphate phosphatase ENTPD5 n=1 Tax=Hyperolius riggenbachi TaxID=752182 RepID=UPI0035A32FAB